VINPKPLKNKSKQPRAIAPDLQEKGRYRASMHSELQKFPDKDKARQLLFGESILDPEQREGIIERYEGLSDLSVPGLKALHAIRVLLERTNYKGNMPGLKVSSPDYKWEGMIPRLSFTYSEYFEAYGLEATGIRGRYEGKGRKEAEEALKELQQPRRMIYKRTNFEGEGKHRRKVTKVISVEKPLITTLAREYRGVTEGEEASIRAGQDNPQRVTRLSIELGVILIEGIEDFYILKSASQLKDMRELTGGTPKPLIMFTDFLQTLDFPTLRIRTEVLAERVTLDYLIKNRHKAKLEKEIAKLMSQAKTLGYLLDYREDPIGLWVLTLNPQKCSRVKA
jgi:hypothetical protein